MRFWKPISLGLLILLLAFDLTVAISLANPPGPASSTLLGPISLSEPMPAALQMLPMLETDPTLRPRLQASTTPTATSPSSLPHLIPDPPQAEPGQPIIIRVEALPAEVVAGQYTVCLELRDKAGQSVDGPLPLSPQSAATATTQFTLSQQLTPGNYQLALTICGWTETDPPPTASPLVTLPYTITARTGQFDQVQRMASPDNKWTAIVNQTANRLDLQHATGETFPVFPANTPVGAVSWSPDSRQLLVVRTNWLLPQAEEGIQSGGPIEIWQVRLDPAPVGPPTRLFQSDSPPEDGPEQIVFGAWSPNSRHIFFWLGILSASIQADGLPVFMLDTETGTATPVAATALLNPRYQSWAPDSSALAITNGGYRSAQVNKWLDLFDVTSGQVTTVVSQIEQIPGIVAWSPQGDLIAYAAVPTTETGDDWADLMTFDNPAIAGRRIYLLDPATNQWRRLNNATAYQDAPVWSEDGTTLYYVQREQDKLVLMAADPQTGVAQPVAGSTRPAPEAVGYYGQSNWSDLLAYRPTAPRAPVPTLSESYRDPAGHYSLRYPAGWSVRQGWQSWSGWQEDLVLSSASADSTLPAELGPFSGQAFITIKTITDVTDTLAAILDEVLAVSGPDQILDRGKHLVAFDRREFQVTGPAGQPITSTLRLETMDGFGIINHVLVVQHEARTLILRGRGDGRVFEAIATSLRLE